MQSPDLEKGVCVCVFVWENWCRASQIPTPGRKAPAPGQKRDRKSACCFALVCWLPNLVNRKGDQLRYMVGQGHKRAVTGVQLNATFTHQVRSGSKAKQAVS